MKYSVYSIQSRNPNFPKKYIGITSNVNFRKTEHKSNCNNATSPRYNYNLYQYIRNNGGWNTFIFSVIQELDIEPSQKGAYERHYFEENGGFNNCLNTRYPHRLKKECNKHYYDNNLNHVRAYYQNNKEQDIIKINLKNYKLFFSFI